MLLKGLTTAIICLFLSSAGIAKVIYDIDFSAGKKIEFPLNTKSWKIKNESLQAIGNHTSIFKINKLSLNNFKFETKIRFVDKIKNDNHAGFTFSGENYTVRIYFRAKKAILMINKNKKNIQHKSLYKFPKPWTYGDDSKWNTIILKVEDNCAELNINGQFAASFDFPKTKVNAFSFYTYGVNSALDDFKITALEKKESDSKPKELVFYADFNKTFIAKGIKDTQLPPSAKKNVKLVDGISGEGVYLTKGNSKLSYPAKNLISGESGSFMFWFRPDWDGTIKNAKRFPTYTLFELLEISGKKALRLFVWNWLRCDINRKGLSNISITRYGRYSWKKGDWNHVAVVWNDKGWNKLFVNGESSPHGILKQFYKKQFPFRAKVSIKDIKTLLIGSAQGTFDEMRVYNYPVKDELVISEYRKFMPVDIYTNNLFVPAGANKIDLNIAPGGTWLNKCNLSEKNINAKINLKLELFSDQTNKKITQKEYTLDIKNKTQVKLPLAEMNEGSYSLRSTIKTANGTMQKSFSIICYKKSPLQKATNKNIKLSPSYKKFILPKMQNDILASGKVKSLKLNGKPYLEAGSATGNRFAFEIEIPDKDIGSDSPVMLEIIWPDNVPRSMGFYMYPKASRKQHRDRLSGGVHSGNEYPLTKKMVKTRYLFWPGKKKYLFEARTMIKNMPAAVAQVNVIPVLSSRLPRLKINFPNKMKARHLGLFDEDQTFEFLLKCGDNSDKKIFNKFYTVKTIERLCDYFDYTGQSAISYSMMRYDYSLLALGGFHGGSRFLKPGVFGAFLDIFTNRNMKFIGGINLYTLPEFAAFEQYISKFRELGCFIEDKDGRTKGSNPTHPVVQKYFINWFKEVLQRHGRSKAFYGIDLIVTKSWCFTSLKNGYDDYTVKSFSRDIGVELPSSNQARYKILTGKYRKEWLKWRADKIYKTLECLSRIANTVNPKLKIYLNVHFSEKDFAAQSATDKTLEQYYLEKYSLNISKINRLQNILISPIRQSGDARWFKHRSNSESNLDAQLYSLKLRKTTGSNKTISPRCFLKYYESFNDSLMPKVYKSYFQNADVKPWGRYFLKEWAWSLAMLDSDTMLLGGQPLGTSGRDDVTREFAKAFCALPAEKFKQVKNTSDPVTVRFLNSTNGTYFYAVNILWSDCNATLQFPEDLQIEDLSTGEIYSTNNKSFKLNLKTYQLRSFLIKNKAVEITSCKIKIPLKTRQFFQNQITLLESTVVKLEKVGINISKYSMFFKRTKKLLQQKRYAELHQLLFSKPANLLRANEKDIKLIAEKENLIKQNKYAVNCGGGYFKAKDGTLFFPDKQYDSDGYGHSEQYASVTRHIALSDKTAYDQLFTTEAYDFDNYKFKVSPGLYDVKLFFKVGYKRNAKPGLFVFNVAIEGKPVLREFDVFKACNNDFSKVIIKEFKNIKVIDGILDIDFSAAKGKSPLARLCNGIIVQKTN